MKESWQLAIIFALCVVCSGEKIVGGRTTSNRVLQSLAHVYIRGYSTCTGSVIGRNWILTAAHCFDGESMEDFPELIEDSWVYVGVLSADPGIEEKSYFFKSVYLHSYYDENDLGSRNDIAVIELEEVIEENSYFPVKLGISPQQNSRVLAAGYGVLNEEEEDPETAMQAYLIAKSFKFCKKKEENEYKEVLGRKYHTCAVSLGFPEQGLTDTCYGDSGGPLFAEKNETLIQYGITSFGSSPCAAAGSHAWYTRVSTYIEDLFDIMKGAGPANFDFYKSIESKIFSQHKHKETFKI